MAIIPMNSEDSPLPKTVRRRERDEGQQTTAWETGRRAMEEEKRAIHGVLEEWKHNQVKG